MENLEPSVAPKDAVDSRTRQLAALSHHLIKHAEAEKAALARQLHQELGAALTVISLDISVVAEKLKHSEPELAARLQRAIAAIKTAVALKRTIVDELRPSMLETFGLSACLTEHLLDFSNRTGLKVTTDICQDFDDIESDRAISIFRIAQESLLNIERHAAASRVWLSLEPQDGGALLQIADNGVGIAAEIATAQESCGLIGMRERVALHGGRFKLGRWHDGSGTVVEAHFPLSP
ncbi:MAG TPA: ATP-binding protein [Burkholderiaceae bacterium]